MYDYRKDASNLTTPQKDVLNKLDGLVSTREEIDNNIGLNIDFHDYQNNQAIPRLSLWGGTIGETALPRIVNGKMTFAPLANGAGYAHYLHSASVKRLFGKFSFGEYTVSGSVVLIAWDSDFQDTYPNIPNGACHMVVTPKGWNYGVVINHVVTSVSSGEFSPYLDINTEYECEVIIDRFNGNAYISLPDGNKTTIQHEQIKHESKYACFELFRNRAEDTIGAFSSIYSSIYSDLELIRFKNDKSATNKNYGTSYKPTTAVTVASPTTRTIVNNNLFVTFKAPESGKVAVTLSAMVEHIVVSNYLWSLLNPATGSALTNQSVSNSVGNKQLTSVAIIEDLTPNETYTLYWQHFTTVANSVNIKFHNASGLYGSMLVTPL